jgi:Tfp pilus assembly protein PilX
MNGRSASLRHRQAGIVMVVAMIFVVLFSALAVSMAALANTNAQVASNQHKMEAALAAAQSGLECAKYVTRTTTLPSTAVNTVSDTDADTVWGLVHTRVAALALDGQTVPASSRLATGNGDQYIVSNLSLGQTSGAFSLRFCRYDASKGVITVTSTGTFGGVTRSISMNMRITKDAQVLTYAIASRGRMWLTGNTTIHGDIFSAWNVASLSPFNMTSDSRVEGTINTVMTRSTMLSHGYEMETLNASGDPIDANGTVLGARYEDRYYGVNDEIQGYHEGINYGQPFNNMPGMRISDYNTTLYKNTIPTTTVSATGPTVSNGKIGTTGISTVTEYFPHAAGNYAVRRDSGSLQLTRYKYENKTFSNVLLPTGKNALFKNCAFNGILYIDAGTTTSNYNNVRFENCTFNGVIITNVPQTFKWQQNCLYFTGTATFNNQSTIQEATVLAPHFNVNLGNTNSQRTDNNILTGAIVGGIVDVRGNAQIYGTIISMCDTSQWTSGYVTNIGATLDDGGSETVEIGDIGTIEVTPAEDQMLPSGITTPIVIKPAMETYEEGV